MRNELRGGGSSNAFTKSSKVETLELHAGGKIRSSEPGLILPTAPEVCRHPLIHACPAHAQVTRVPAARGSSMAPFTSQVAELVQPYLTRGDLRSLQNVGPWCREGVGGRQVQGFRFRV